MERRGRAIGAEPGAGDYAREAVSQWATAARLGAAALTPGLKNLAPDLSNVNRAAPGGAVGGLADKALAKMGPPGKLASRPAGGEIALWQPKG